MTVTLDARQCFAEIEHALLKRFPFSSTSITHATDSESVATIQVSWVASAGSECNVMVRVDESIMAEAGRGQA